MNHDVTTDAEQLGKLFLDSTASIFRSQKTLADRAIEQLGDEQLHQALDPETNSVAVIMKHMAGNMLSRWTDFLTTDGEKPWRHRDSEFVDDMISRNDLPAFWERGWTCLFNTIDALTPADLDKTIFIRQEPHTVFEAIHRQVSHYGYHVGQIVQVARILAQDNWTVLTVPRKGSEAFNELMRQKAAARASGENISNQS